MSKLMKISIFIVIMVALTFFSNLIVYKIFNVITIADTKFLGVSFLSDWMNSTVTSLKSTLTSLSSTNSSQVQRVVSEALATNFSQKTKGGNWTKSKIKGQVTDPVNPHNFNYVIVPKVNCSHALLVICVLGRMNSFAARMAKRKTLGSYVNVTTNSATLIFFIGSEPPSINSSSASVQPVIDREADIFGDILQEDYVDHYLNLSLKTVSILKWVTQKCTESRFVLKVDDDVYINAPKLVDTLTSMSESKGPFILGYVFDGVRPVRKSDSKWYTKLSDFNESFYPRYTSGPSYAMTTSAARLLFQASLQIPVFKWEDVYITGLCAKWSHVEVVHSDLFYYDRRPPTGCSFRNQISGHRYTADEIIRIHKELYNTTIKC